MADKVPRSGRDKTESKDAIGRSRVENVAGDLFSDKSSVRLVVVECSDHVVSVGPRIGPKFVFVVAAGIRVFDYVQPVPSPAFAILRRRQQPVDQLFVRIRTTVVNEGFDFGRRRRQTDQVKCEPPN